jgi:hypothetical protein
MITDINKCITCFCLTIHFFCRRSLAGSLIKLIGIPKPEVYVINDKDTIKLKFPVTYELIMRFNCYKSGEFIRKIITLLYIATLSVGKPTPGLFIRALAFFFCYILSESRKCSFIPY